MYIYTEVMERSPKDGGDDNAQGFYPSIYCCIPLKPPVACVNQLAKVVTCLSLPAFPVHSMDGEL
jgi:hypothetical protein